MKTATKNLPADIKIRVVTNSIIIAEELRKNDNISVIMLGGEMDDKGNCYDAIAVETIRRLRFDKCFITSACISVKFGLSIQRSQAISFWNALIDSSKQKNSQASLMSSFILQLFGPNNSL